MTLKTADIAILRQLLPLARKLHWEHLIYGGDGCGREQQHVWRSSSPWTRHREQIDLWHGALEYKPADAANAKSMVQPGSAAEALAWLQSLRLTPSRMDVARAVLTPDCESLPAEVGS